MTIKGCMLQADSLVLRLQVRLYELELQLYEYELECQLSPMRYSQYRPCQQGKKLHQ